VVDVAIEQRQVRPSKRHSSTSSIERPRTVNAPQHPQQVTQTDQREPTQAPETAVETDEPSQSEHPQTGPKTSQGKERSAMNALRDGAYVARALDEDEREKFKVHVEALDEALEASGVQNDPMAFMANQTLAMAQLRAQRLAAIETRQLHYWMETPGVRDHFIKEAGLGYHQLRGIPTWFFKPYGCEEKQHAESLVASIHQARRLKEKFSEQAIEHVAFSYPALYKEVIALAPRSQASFSKILITAFKKENVADCLEPYAKWVTEEHPWEIQWVENASRYTSIIEYLRAKTQLEIMAHDGRLKLQGQLHKQAMQSLAVLQTLRSQAALMQKNFSPSASATSPEAAQITVN
jgi:hypothetical protein